MGRFKYVLFALAALTTGYFLIGRTPFRNLDPLNRDGIRSDVAVAIDELYPGPEPTHLAVIQLARAFQRAIDHPEDALEVHAVYFKAKCCLRAVTEAEDDSAADLISRTLESLTVNTWARSRSYVKYNANLSGGVYPMTQPRAGDCEFDLE